MKKIICLILVLVFTLMLNAEKFMSLNEISKPELIEIADGKLYIMEGATIFLYDIQKKKLIKSFCRRGEGPGELKSNQGIPNFLVLTENSVLAVSMDKAVEFTKNGKLLRDIKTPIFTNYIYPVKHGYIGMKLNMGKESIVKVNILDKDLKAKKNIYSQKLSGGQNLIDLTFDGINIAIENNKLYVDESANGFDVGIYDLTGTLLKRIKKNVPRIEFTDKHKKEALEIIKNNSQIKQMGWENFKKIVKIINQKYLPPIQDMVVNSGKTYIKTNKKDGTKVEFLVFNDSGKEIKKLLLPSPMESNFISKIFCRPARFYKFYNDIYYYLIENEDDEEWELHSIKI